MAGRYQDDVKIRMILRRHWSAEGFMQFHEIGYFPLDISIVECVQACEADLRLLAIMNKLFRNADRIGNSSTPISHKVKL